MLLCSSCKRDESESEWQHKIKQAAELSTVQYTVQQIISNNDESWKIFGNRKILIQYQAIIKAGLNMENFDPSNVKITVDKKKKTKSISIVLPQPEIFSHNIKPDGIEQIYKEVSWLRSDYTNAERDSIATLGEKALINDAELNNMILKDARVNASKFFEVLLKQNGFSTVNITFAK